MRLFKKRSELRFFKFTFIKNSIKFALFKSRSKFYIHLKLRSLKFSHFSPTQILTQNFKHSLKSFPLFPLLPPKIPKNSLIFSADPNLLSADSNVRSAAATNQLLKNQPFSRMTRTESQRSMPSNGSSTSLFTQEHVKQVGFWFFMQILKGNMEFIG